MKPKYDFSKAERGKFYRLETKFNTPIYLTEKGPILVDKVEENSKQQKGKLRH